MTRSEVYQTHLDRVSRSFAFCIRQLPEPLRAWVGLSYLLCRVVDTIEDSPWPNQTAQLAAFQAFDGSLVEPSRVADLALRVRPLEMSPGERELLADCESLMRDFHQLPEGVRSIMRELVLSMSRGMQHFCRERRDGSLRLRNLAEVNQYCFFVAGVVGELLANLVARVEPRFGLSQRRLLSAHHFGLFLQKVNLLKDQVSDERVGRHLIPSRELVEESSRENAAEALDFLLAVPREQMEFRRFCAWSLFLGLEALSVARDSQLRQRVLKVPRHEMEKILERVESALADDGALHALFEGFMGKLGWSRARTAGPRARDIPEWLLELYQGPLDAQSLIELGLALAN